MEVEPLKLLSCPGVQYNWKRYSGQNKIPGCWISVESAIYRFSWKRTRYLGRFQFNHLKKGGFYFSEERLKMGESKGGFDMTRSNTLHSFFFLKKYLFIIHCGFRIFHLYCGTEGSLMAWECWTVACGIQFLLRINKGHWVQGLILRPEILYFCSKDLYKSYSLYL